MSVCNNTAACVCTHTLEFERFFLVPLDKVKRTCAHTHTGRLPAAQNHRDKELADVHIYLKGEQLLYVHDKKRS